ncbi:MAG: DUF4293 domain-containing protein [Bacteroidales bacterium]|nr:DUF4293 domain-containing protein [Bacteroidales bacterium]
MLQRIQSLLLFLAAICYVLACFMPVANLTTADAYYQFNVWNVRENIPDGRVVYQVLYIGLSLIALAIFTIVTIFLYKNRMRQSKLCMANVLLGFIVLAVTLYVYPDLVFQKINVLKGCTVAFSMKALLPILGVVLVYVANKFILKDEKKVRDAERLR